MGQKHQADRQKLTGSSLQEMEMNGFVIRTEEVRDGGGEMVQFGSLLAQIAVRQGMHMVVRIGMFNIPAVVMTTSIQAVSGVKLEAIQL
jgi:hypothetical protein